MTFFIIRCQKSLKFCRMAPDSFDKGIMSRSSLCSSPARTFFEKSSFCRLRRRKKFDGNTLHRSLHQGHLENEHDTKEHNKKGNLLS